MGPIIPCLCGDPELSNGNPNCLIGLYCKAVLDHTLFRGNDDIDHTLYKIYTARHVEAFSTIQTNLSQYQFCESRSQLNSLSVCICSNDIIADKTNSLNTLHQNKVIRILRRSCSYKFPGPHIRRRSSLPNCLSKDRLGRNSNDRL